MDSVPVQAVFRDVTPSLLPCSHLQGMFFRTARMLEAGVKPVYVFDGMPPAAKKEELARRWAALDWCIMCTAALARPDKLVRSMPRSCLIPCEPSAIMLAKLRLCRFERRGEATEDLAEAKEVQTPGAASCVSLH